MGWDSVGFNGQYELCRDSDLWLLRHFFIRGTDSIAQAMPPTSVDELRTFFERWDWLGNGVFAGADFSEFVAGDSSRLELLFRALQFAADIIAEFGDAIPLSYVYPIGISRWCQYLKDQPTRPLLEIIGRLCKLLSRGEQGKPESK